MPKHKVEPVPGYEDALLEDYAALPLPCADGFSSMIDILETQEPSVRDRCGLIADRHELYAVPLPDCGERVMLLSIDRKARARPRALHGTLPASKSACDRGARIAIGQLGLVNPSWET